MAEYLLHLSMSFDRTPYEGIKKLPPAHCLTVTPEQMQLRQYFELSAEPALKLKDSREYVDAYREQLGRGNPVPSGFRLCHRLGIERRHRFFHRHRLCRQAS